MQQTDSDRMQANNMFFHPRWRIDQRKRKLADGAGIVPQQRVVIEKIGSAGFIKVLHSEYHLQMLFL